jgi:transcriptional regulator with PAS, ATPase and Fis domain
MQVKLLRVLQNGEFERVGGTKTIKTDVRLISATNKNLMEEIQKGKFREDLYYRINVVILDIPPLRDRKEDIAVLLDHFVKMFSKRYNKKISQISPDVIRNFENYHWPGNVRELKNIVERMVVLSQNEKLANSDIPQDIYHLKNSASGVPAHLNIRQAEAELIRSKLKELKGNKSKAASALGISRRTLYRKMDEYKIQNA